MTDTSDSGRIVCVNTAQLGAERITSAAPENDQPCEVDECRTAGTACWCGNAHCPDHPHLAEVDEDYWQEWPDDQVDAMASPEELARLRSAQATAAALTLAHELRAGVAGLSEYELAGLVTVFKSAVAAAEVELGNNRPRDRADAALAQVARDYAPRDPHAAPRAHASLPAAEQAAANVLLAQWHAEDTEH